MSNSILYSTQIILCNTAERQTWVLELGHSLTFATSDPQKSLKQMLQMFMLVFSHGIVQLNKVMLLTWRDSSPKNENSVIIYSPSSSSKPAWMSLFCWTQRKIFWRMWETEQLWSTIDFSHRMEFNGLQYCLVPNILKHTFFCVAEESCTGLKQYEGKYYESWQNWH